MRRREFLCLAGGAVAAWPRLARAQQTRKLPTVVFPGPTLICSCQRSAGEAETGDAAWARIMSNLMLSQSPTS
jgi:hypothetical protein